MRLQKIILLVDCSDEAKIKSKAIEDIGYRCKLNCPIRQALVWY
ncbi:hypothetical protein [Robertmurraya sp. Marseille-Q9965]